MRKFTHKSRKHSYDVIYLVCRFSWNKRICSSKSKKKDKGYWLKVRVLVTTILESLVCF